MILSVAVYAFVGSKNITLLMVAAVLCGLCKGSCGTLQNSLIAERVEAKSVPTSWLFVNALTYGGTIFYNIVGGSWQPPTAEKTGTTPTSSALSSSPPRYSLLSLSPNKKDEPASSGPAAAGSAPAAEAPRSASTKSRPGFRRTQWVSACSMLSAWFSSTPPA